MFKEILGAIGAVLIVIAIVITFVTGSPQKGENFFMSGVSVIAKPITWSIERANTKLQKRLSVMTQSTAK